MQAKQESPVTYSDAPLAHARAQIFDDHVIAAAITILERRMTRYGMAFNGPNDGKSFLRLKLGQYDHEVFAHNVFQSLGGFWDWF